MASFVHLIDQRRLIGPGGSTTSGEIYFYYTGTTVKAPIFSDAALLIPLSNPVVVGAGSIIPLIFLNDSIQYRRVIQYADGSIDEQDPIGNLFSDGDIGLPVGSVIDYSGESPPSGFLFCFGQEISRSDYSELFNTIGTQYGPGNGSTTFNLPDYRGRVGAGKDNMGGSAAGRLATQLTGSVLGAVGGAEGHVLTIAQLAAHAHNITITDPGHTHGIPVYGDGNSGNFIEDAGGGTLKTVTSNSATTGITATSASQGSSAEHNNVQPTIVINKIIKTSSVSFLSLFGINLAEEAASAVASIQLASAAVQAGIENYYGTIAEGVANTAVGSYFASPETGTVRIYLRTATTPFYLDQGDSVAPVTVTQLTLSEAAAAASANLAQTYASSAAAAMNSSNAPYPNAYASTLPKGVTSTTITAAGTGGTAGTYALGVSGGPTGFAGTYTISGGGVTAITITNPGLSTATTAPSLSFPSGSVTGATATATVSTLIADQKTYWVASSDSSQILLYGNNGGSIATAPFGGTQLALSGKTQVDAALARSLAYARWVRQVTPTTVKETSKVYSPTTGAGSTNASYKAVTLTLTGSELGLRATARVSGTGNALACYYDAGGTFISSEVVGTGTPTTYTNQTLNPPATARKVIVCGTSNTPIGIDVLTAPTTQTVLTQAGLGNQAAASLASAIDSGITPTTGSYIDTFGNIVVSASYKYLEYTVTARDISYTATGTTSGAAMVLVAYLDSDGETISTQFQGGGSPVAYTNQALTVPADTAKIRMSGTSSPTLALTITQIAASAATQIAAAQAAAGRGGAAATALDVYQASGIAAINGSYISSAGAVVVGAGFQYLDYTLDGTETGFQASGSINGASTQLANYVNAAGTSLGIQFVGTGSSVAYTNQTLTIPNGTTKIRLCGNILSPLTLSVKKPLANAGSLIQSGSGNTAISVWGDSMANMLSPVLAALYPTRTSYNEGIGGQTTQQVAARMGALQVTATSGFTMPATVTTVSVAPSIDLLFSNRSTAWSCRVLVMGIECWLVCAASTGAYTLQPVTAPGTAFTIPAGTNIRVISGAVSGSDPSAQPLLKTILSGTVVVRASRNDTATITTSGGRTTILGYMQAIVTQVAAYGGNLMLMTGTNGTFDMPTSSGLPGASQTTAALSDSALAGIAAFNALLMATFPDAAIDPLANHVMRGGSTNQTPVSTTYAVLDSSTLQSDGLHENTATGQPRTAALVQAVMNSRGY